MRLWTIHPKYLDARGLVALWREALLAQKVLHNKTKGYKNHPQLVRFRDQRNPSQSIAAYLHTVYEEADSRGYCFDSDKIAGRRARKKITAPRGQLLYEWAHLQKKLQLRAPVKLAEIKQILQPEAHPLFDIVDGNVEAWEKIAALRTRHSEPRPEFNVYPLSASGEGEGGEVDAHQNPTP